ncbi:adenosine receptor A2a-like [Patiria miniata]|uniref:G-protein coupled receptors family 1 profile domain-containing protein n=1 Tax=Patiria miniata TaxID=46514 RepID=A0A913ZMY1_PATMI|nr:adenosine receptor A2a-like [Patiria miniata]
MDVNDSAGSWVAVGFLVLIGVIAIIGNVLLVYLVIAKQELRENLNYFVLSLASVDLLTALLIMPLQSYHSAVEVSTEGALCVCINVLAVMAAMASVLSLVCVTFDRYLVISKPLRYVTLVTTHRALGAIAFLWLYSIGVSLLILIPDEMTVEPPMGISNSSVTCNIDTLIGLPYGYFLMCNFFIPIPAMFVMYAHIFVIARRHARAIHDVRRVSCVDPALPQPSLIKQNVRIAAVLSVITTYFLLSWTSTIVILAVMRHMPEYEFQLTIVYKIIFYTNAAFNPFLYMFHHRTLRAYLVKTVRRKFSRVPPGTVGPSPLVSTVSLDVPRPRINSLFEPACSRRPSFRLQQNP